jgi:hypothetical protein
MKRYPKQRLRDLALLMALALANDGSLMVPALFALSFAEMRNSLHVILPAHRLHLWHCLRQFTLTHVPR